MMKTALRTAIGVCCAALISTGSFAAELLINGAGATFPYPIYSKWFDTYSHQKGGVRFNYQSIGSGGGVKQIIAQTVDFGASDGPMKDEEMEKASGRILHIPTVMGAVTLAYNVEGVGSGLKLTGENVVDIFLGKIKRWNDAKIAQNNPGVSLPDQEIVTVHRSDGSGTTDIFTNYLASVSLGWKMQVGAGKSVKWPVGLGGKGNEGVAGTVKNTPGSIGYMELTYAKLNNLSYVHVQNKAGNFIEPSIESTSAAMKGAKIPSDYRMSIVNQPGQDAYPIAGLTWLLVYQKQKNEAKGKALVDFLWWAMHEGQTMTGELGYSPLPPEVVGMVEQTLAKISYNGKSILNQR